MASRRNKTRVREVALAGDLTIDRAGALREELLAALAEPGELVVDLARLGRVDLAGHQLLCAAHRAAHRDGRKFTFVGTVPARPGAPVRPGPCPRRDDGSACCWGGA